MNTECLDKFKSIYSKYIEISVDFHNQHMKFTKIPSVRRGYALRRKIRELSKLQREMSKLSDSVLKEHTKNSRLLREQKQKGSKNGNNNRTIKKTV